MSWPLVKLGDLFKVTSGGTPSRRQLEYYENGTIPWIKTGDLHNKYVTSASEYITQEGLDGSSTRMYPKGTVLVAMYGATIGACSILDIDACTNQACAAFTPSEKVDINFLYYLLKQSKSTFVKAGSGGAQPNISATFLKEFKIPLPPLDEQKRIAAILDKADSLRRKRQQAIQLADDFLRSVFLDMFGDPVTNPKGWEVKKFGEVIDVLTDYHANGSYKTLVKNVTLFDEPNYAYMVRTTDLEKKNYTESVKYIDQHAYEHLSKSKVFGGEIIMNKIGSAGAVYLMPYLNKPVSLAMNQFMIRCNELSTNEFMYYQLKTDAGAREIAKRVQGAVTKTITKDAVRDVSVIVPPIELQNKFIEIVGKIKKLKIGINDSYELTKSEFNSLSQKAFAGEL